MNLLDGYEQEENLSGDVPSLSHTVRVKPECFFNSGSQSAGLDEENRIGFGWLLGFIFYFQRARESTFQVLSNHQSCE